jgi:hypothetical protein
MSVIIYKYTIYLPKLKGKIPITPLLAKEGCPLGRGGLMKFYYPELSILKITNKLIIY